MSDIITFDTNEIVFGKQSNPAPAFKCSGFGLGELIKDMHNPVGLEIGCDIGDTAHFLLDSNPTLYLYSVDPYENYVDWNGNNFPFRSFIMGSSWSGAHRIFVLLRCLEQRYIYRRRN